MTGNFTSKKNSCDERGRNKLPATPWGMLPPHLNVLRILGPSAHDPAANLAAAFASDEAVKITLTEVTGITAGVSQLRELAYDVVLVNHSPPQLDALDVVDAIRAASCDEQPLLVLGTADEAEMSAVCFEAGADGYVCLSSATVRSLLWQLARAHERRLLITENRRLQQDQRHRLQLEHDEAARLLAQQRALIADLQQIRGDDPMNHVSRSRTVTLVDQATELPEAILESLQTHYRELLQAYVIMGSGNLGEDLQRLSEDMAKHQVTSQQVMRLHLRVLENAVQGLGSRSARHVMNRADLLILEVMLNLAERYRLAANSTPDSKLRVAS